MRTILQREFVNASEVSGQNWPPQRRLARSGHFRPYTLRDLVFPLFMRLDGAVHIKEAEHFVSEITGSKPRTVRHWFAGDTTIPGDALALILAEVAIRLSKSLQRD